MDNGALPYEQKPLQDDIKVFNGTYYEKPSHFYNAGIAEIIKINGIYGYNLKCTLDHKIMVYRNGEEVKIPASEVNQNDKLCVPINFNLTSNNKLPSKYLNIKKNYSHSKIEVNNDQTMAYIPIKSIEEAGYEQTYCLTMPETHLFVQNGILAGNCQGSQFKYIIIALDNSSYPLLMREWLYTALTRARKYCVLVGQPSAINMATRTSNIKVKQTWLKDELYKVVLEDAGVKK